MDKNKKYFITWKLMLLLPIVIGIWFIYLGWGLNDLGGGILVFGGILGVVFCGCFILFAKYNPKEDWMSRSIGGKLKSPSTLKKGN